MSHKMTEEDRKQQRLAIMKKTEELVELIIQSEDYVRYQKKLEELKEDEGVYARMSEFRRKNLELQILGEEGRFYDDMHTLYSEYTDILLDPLVSRFMITEQSILKLMRKVQNCIAEGIEIDISYM